MNEQQETIVSLNETEMTAGEMLKNARTTGRRKREIATISKLLCIREEFLTALEECNYRVIPEDVYILGFARSYAMELGLDPDVVIAKLKKELGIVKDKKEIKETKEDTVVKAKTQTPKTESKHIVFTRENMSGWIKAAIQYVKKNWIWFVGGLLGVVLVIVVLAVFAGGKSDETVPTDGVPVVAQDVVVVPEPDFRYPIHEKFDTKNAKEARVVLQAEKESWVKIEDARGNSVFSRVLIPGDVYYLPDGDKFKATFGNVGAIDVWVDGHLIKKLGPANTKKTGISLVPDALKAIGFAE